MTSPLRATLHLLALLGLYLAASLTPYDVRQTGTATGEASWYDDGPGYYGAVHSYRWGDPQYTVTVCRADNPKVCVDVRVRDHMANPVRAIDLSPAAFRALAPLSRGVVQVTVSAGPRMTLPPTDTED